MYKLSALNIGRRSGYAYEYQQKIAAYAGWTYEYVKGSWPELLQMLIDGEIDCVFQVNFTDSDAEDRDVLIASPQMPSEMRAVVRSAALGGFSLEGTSKNLTFPQTLLRKTL